MTDAPLVRFARAVAGAEEPVDPETEPEVVIGTAAVERPDVVAEALGSLLADLDAGTVTDGELRLLGVLARDAADLVADHAGLLVRTATNATGERQEAALDALYDLGSDVDGADAVSTELRASLGEPDPHSVTDGELRILAVLARAAPDLAAGHADLLAETAVTAADDRRGIALGAVAGLARERPRAVPAEPLQRLAFDADAGERIRRRALLALSRVDPDAIRSHLAALDPASVPAVELRLVGALARAAPDVAVEGADLLAATAATATGERREAALDALFDLVARVDGADDVAAVREAVAGRPAVVEERLRALAADLDPEEPAGRTLRVLEVLAPAVPDPAAEAVPALVTVVEEQGGPGRRAALAALAPERPDAIPTDRLRRVALADDTDEATRRHALAALALVDASAATDALATYSGRLADEHDFAYPLDRFLAALVTDHPEAFPALSEAVAEQLAAMHSGDQERAIAAVADLARERPAAVAPGAAALAPLALDYRRSVRSAAALALRSVGRVEPEALPEWATPLAEAPRRELRERPDEADDPMWPLGGLAKSSPEVGPRAAERLVATLGEEYEPDPERAAEYVAELERGDADAARDVAAALATATFRRWPAEGEGTPATLVRHVLEACPSVAPAVVEPLVAGQAEGVTRESGEEIGAQSVHAAYLIEALAEHAPEELRRAVESHYDGPAAYVEQPGGHRESRRQAASEAFEEYDAGYSDVTDWLSLSEVRETYAAEYDPEDESVPDGRVAGRIYRLLAPLALWALLNLVIAIAWFGERFGPEEEPDDGGGGGGGGDGGDEDGDEGGGGDEEGTEGDGGTETASASERAAPG